MEEGENLGRIEAFTDGVMAVAITLLVLNVEVPELRPGTEAQLEEQLVDLLPTIAAYALSFALVGRYWVLHHRLFETLRAFDGTLMGLNLVFLALIGLVPFATELSDRYGEDAVAAAVFGATMGLAGLVHWLMAAYTFRRELVHDRHRAIAEERASWTALSVSLVFLLSVPLAYVDVRIAQVMWLSTIVLRGSTLRRLAR